MCIANIWPATKQLLSTHFLLITNTLANASGILLTTHVVHVVRYAHQYTLHAHSDTYNYTCYILFVATNITFKLVIHTSFTSYYF